jgi:hypothetical protein
MTDISANIRLLREQIPGRVKIVAISKTMTVSDIMTAYNTGHRIFGENRAGEFLLKAGQLPRDIEWHFVGHLQTNKVKQLAGKVSLIHSVDSLKLLEAINRESEKAGCITNCLIQFHIAREETKFGFSLEEAHSAFKSGSLRKLGGIRLCGVMGMATFSDDMELVRGEFRYLKSCFDQLKLSYFHDLDYFTELSMGMSGDYTIAIEEGATIVRIGSLIFGERRKAG